MHTKSIEPFRHSHTFGQDIPRAGEIARSALGAFAEKLINAQFSQQEEREADDYGVLYSANRGYDRRSAISALTKLASLGSDHSFLSSHPAPEARAKRLQENASAPQQIEESRLLRRIIDWLKGFWPFTRG